MNARIKELLYSTNLEDIIIGLRLLVLEGNPIEGFKKDGLVNYFSDREGKSVMGYRLTGTNYKFEGSGTTIILFPEIYYSIGSEFIYAVTSNSAKKEDFTDLVNILNFRGRLRRFYYLYR